MPQLMTITYEKPPKTKQDTYSSQTNYAKLNINLFGTCVIKRGDGSRVEFSTRKSEALFTYLAINHDRPLTREHLSDLCWSRSADRQARASLRQELLNIKKAFDGNELFLQTGAREIQLNMNSLYVDVLEFQRFAKSSNLADLNQAVSLYKGEFLAGRYGPDPVYEEWLNAERMRLDNLAFTAMEHVFTDNIANNNFQDACVTATKMCELQPFSEQAVHNLIKAYSYQGKISEAHEALQAYERRTKEASLSVDTTELKKLMSEISSCSKAFLQGVKIQKCKTTKQKIETISKSNFPRIAILPFKTCNIFNQSTPGAEGLGADLMADLGRFKLMKIVSRNVMQDYENRRASLAELASEVEATFVVEGVFRDLGVNLRLDVTLSDTRTGEEVWAERFDFEKEQLVTTQNEKLLSLAYTIYRQIIHTCMMMVNESSETNFTLFDYIIRAIVLIESINKIHNQQAQTACLEAIKLDEKSSQAYTLLSISKLLDGRNCWIESPIQALKTARKAGVKAIELNPQNNVAYTACGTANLYLGNFELAIEQLAKSCELNPGSPDAMAFLSLGYSYKGEAERALLLIKKARKLFPNHPLWYLQIEAQAHYCLGNFTKALDNLKRLTSHLPDYTIALVLKAACHEANGETENAGIEVEKIYKIAPALTLDTMASMSPYQDQKQYEKYITRLKKSGL